MKTTGLFWCGFAHELHVTTSNIKLYIKRPSSVHGCPWLSGHRKVKHQRSSKLLTRHTNSQKSWSCVRKPPNKISKNKVSKYVHILSLLYINNWKTSQENKKCPKRPPPVYYYIFLVLNLHIDYDIPFRFPSGSPIDLFDQKTSSTGWAKQLEKDGSPSSLQLSKLTLFWPRISQ